MRNLLLLLALASAPLAAAPIHHYTLHGTITGSDEAIALLEGIHAGMPFEMKLSIDGADPDCGGFDYTACASVAMNLGSGWFSLPAQVSATGFDSAPERVLFDIASGAPLAATHGGYSESGFYLALLGLGGIPHPGFSGDLDSPDYWNFLASLHEAGEGLRHPAWGSSAYDPLIPPLQAAGFTSGWFSLDFFANTPGGGSCECTLNGVIEQFAAVGIPEPSPALLLGLGLLGVGGVSRRRCGSRQPA